MILHLDFETRSHLELEDVGIHNYASHPETKILMLAYAFGKGEVRLWEPHLGMMPGNLQSALSDPSIRKGAWNAGFERNIFRYKLGIEIPYELWDDPMINARFLSMPGSLDSVGEILDLDYGLRKDKAGDELLKLFSSPLPIKKPRKKATNENTLFDISPIVEEKIDYIFADHISHPDEWERLKAYCRQDIVAERALGEMLSHFALPEKEIKIWHLDQKINDAGMPADKEFVQKALDLAIEDKNLQSGNLIKMTGLPNANSPKQFLSWVQKQGYPYNSLRKEPVKVAMSDPEVKLTKLGREALEVRKKSSKTSYTKLAAILPALSEDSRLRDQFLFMGSSRAGRWSGKAVQLHNMARPIKTVEEIEDINAARDLIYAKDFGGIVKRFEEKDKVTGEAKPGSVIDVVTSCIRSSFVAPSGKRLNVCDLNAIENRVLGWVAGEDKILDVFRNGRCPYMDFASKMYKVPYDIIADTSKTPHKPRGVDGKEKRQVAKPAVLGAGYRLAGGKWGVNPKTKDRIKTGLWGYAENMGVLISQDLAVASVKAFRAEYKKVVSLWYDSERAVAKCIREGGQQPIGPTGLVWCDRKKRKDGSLILRIHLPSGRHLHYLNAGLDTTVMEGDNGSYERENFVYDGIDQITRQWGVVRSHGGKIVENVVQAISRDVLAESMLEADEVGFELIGHVHDEIVTLSDDTEDSLGLVDLKCIMSTTPTWAPGLPLNAEGYEGYFYRKG